MCPKTHAQHVRCVVDIYVEEMSVVNLCWERAVEKKAGNKKVMAQRRAKQHKVESKNRPEKDHQSDETEEIEAAMMCWEKSEGSLVKES